MLRCEVNDLLDKETRMWFERSCSLWAVHGDKNWKYFHSRVTPRHQKNIINGIKNPLGQWCTDPKVIAREVIDCYSNLFSSSNTCQPELALEAIETILTKDMNRQLVADFKECEIHEALNKMGPLKSLSPDGMPPFFFQHYWDLVGKEITSLVLSFLNSAILPEHLNHTYNFDSKS